MDFDSVLSWVQGELGALQGWLLAELASVLAFTEVGLNDLWTALDGIWQFFLHLGEAIALFLYHVWEDYLKPLFDWLIEEYQKISAWLKHILGPLLKIISQVRAWFYKYVYPWIVLAQDILSRIRVILTLFNLVGVKWAAALDAWVQKIQGYITEALQGIVSSLNAATTWISIIADPAQVLRRDFFTGTLFSSLASVKRAGAFGMSRPLTAVESQNQAQDQALMNGGAAVLTSNPDGSVTYSPAMQRINSSFDDAARYYGV